MDSCINLAVILNNASEQGFSKHFWKLQHWIFWIYLTQMNNLISWLIDLLYDLSWVSPVRETMCMLRGLEVWLEKLCIKVWPKYMTKTTKQFFIWDQNAHFIFVQTTDANCHKLLHITWLKPHTDSNHKNRCGLWSESCENRKNRL